LGEDEKKMLRLIARSEGLFVAYCRFFARLILLSGVEGLCGLCRLSKRCFLCMVLDRRREARVCNTRLSFRRLIIIVAERRAVARELFSCG